MDSATAFAQLQLRLVDQTQWRYEVIRPLVLFADRTATQRAQETATHPETFRAHSCGDMRSFLAVRRGSCGGVRHQAAA
jgi:hypothetical protein